MLVNRPSPAGSAKSMAIGLATVSMGRSAGTVRGALDACEFQMEDGLNTNVEPSPNAPKASTPSAGSAAADQGGTNTGDGPKVLVIGLDGATFDVLKPLMAEGRLPRLASAVESGSSGILHSTTPPITPAAWTSFLTGKQPSGHGILDFERYDVRTNKLLMNSTRCLDGVSNIWRILGDRGLRVGSVNVPMTYPAVAVNGFMISGFETPGPDKDDFVYPRDLRGPILERWSDPTLRTNWRRKTLGGDALFRRNVDYMSASFDQGAAMTRFCGDRFGWDVLMVVFKLVDNLQHKTWRYIDPRWSDRNAHRREIVNGCFERMDRAVGDLLDYAKSHGAVVLMVSDHGHGSLDGKVQPNLLLKNWGYLKLTGGGAQGATRAKYLWDRFRGRTKKFARAGDVLHDLAVDFSRTRACVMHAGMAGFLYINLEGRQPDGIVPPGEYEKLRDELVARFLSVDCEAVDPSGRKVQLFKAVHKPEELYDCSREGREWMPDLILTPHDGLAAVRKIRGSGPVQWLRESRIEGTHRSEGIFIATGPGIRHDETVDAHIVDCAPTILTLMNVPVPEDMHGRVITEIFDTPPQIATQKVATQKAAASPSALASDGDGGAEEGYSEEDLAKITERLSDLGYLE